MWIFREKRTVAAFRIGQGEEGEGSLATKHGKEGGFLLLYLLPTATVVGCTLRIIQ